MSCLCVPGEIGSAAKMGLVVNLLGSTILAGLAESLALAEKVGLDQEEVLQILQLSAYNCSFIKSKGTGKKAFNLITTCTQRPREKL